jgi:hypothetical protein
MIEAQVCKYLNDLKIPAYMEEPKNKGSEYVVLQSIDNGRINYIDAVTFNITCYSTSLQKACELNNRVKAAMYDITAIDNISSSKCGGGGQDIDTTTKRYAYYSVFNLYYTEE